MQELYGGEQSICMKLHDLLLLKLFRDFVDIETTRPAARRASGPRLKVLINEVSHVAKRSREENHHNNILGHLENRNLVSATPAIFRRKVGVLYREHQPIGKNSECPTPDNADRNGTRNPEKYGIFAARTRNFIVALQLKSGIRLT